MPETTEKTITLHDLAIGAGIPEMPEANPTITGIADDSRAVRHGHLFVGVRGEAADGRTFFGAAVRAGAVALAGYGANPEFPGIPFLSLADDRTGAALLASTFYGRPADRLKMVGVTGTNGKTTTTYILESIMEAAMIPCGVLGTIRYSTGARTVESRLTTPGPVALQALLHEMVANGKKACAMEVSSHALSQRRTHGMKFDATIITNVTQDHFDYHGDFASYRDSKALILERLRENGAVCLNGDDESADWFASKAPPHARLVRFGISAAGFLDFRATVRSMDAGGTAFRMETPEGRFDVKTPLFGLHNVSNCLGAAAAAWGVGVDLTAIAAGIAQIGRVPGRLERVPIQRDFTVVVDYAHTHDALGKILWTLRPLVRSRLIVVFGCGGDRDKKKRPLMGRAAEAGADLCIVTADNPRTESPTAIIDDIVAGFRDKANAIVEPDRKTAIELALSMAGPGDWVLLAGKGHEDYQIVGTEKRPFSDRDVCRAWAGNSEKEEAGAA